MMNRESMHKLRLDRRLLDRQAWISKPELESELESLPDSAHKAMTLGDAEDESKPGDPAASPLSAE